ncbi:MAG: alpha-mannosidase [Candidatus Thorarchaeota archaeon]|nr:alpha-mannosidase [Candidatus Thorarchaeota archaeon]
MDSSERSVLNICPFSHFDNADVETYEHNMSMAAWNLKAVLDFLDRDDKHRFCIGQTTLLEGFQKLFPNYWDKLQERILEGSLELVGGTYVMPDFVLPDGESIARQFVFGKRYAKQKLGVDIQTGWAIDSAGFCSQIPQILRLSGIDSLFLSRGMPYDGPSEFSLVAPDGSRVFAIWLSEGYDLAAWLSESKREAFSQVMLAIDKKMTRNVSGNLFLAMGGELVAPPMQLSEVIETWNELFGDMRSTIVTPSEYVEKIKSVQAKLPKIQGPLLSNRFRHVASGGLSSRVELKLLNRKLEGLLYVTEICLALSENHSKSKALDNEWKMLLFNQDHNIIRGICGDKPYRMALRRYNNAIEKADGILENQLRTLGADLATDDGVGSILVVNPLSWIRTDVARVRLGNVELSENIEIINPAGEVVPHQIVEDDNGLVEAVFIAENMPSTGFRIYTIREEVEESEFDSLLECGDSWMESNEFVLNFDEYSGSLCRLFDKTNEGEVFNGMGPTISVENEVGDLYSHHSSELASEKQKLDSSRNEGEIKIIESGPIAAIAEIHGTISESPFKQRVTLYRSIRRIDIETKLDFKGIHRRVRLRFPTHVYADEVTVGAQFGVEKRHLENHDFRSRRELEDFPALDWVDCSGPDSGICFSNVGLHEYSFQDGILEVTLLRSVDWLSHGKHDTQVRTPLAKEEGIHTFRGSIIPHDGDWQEARVWRSSTEHRIPLVCSFVDGSLNPNSKRELSWLRVEGCDLCLSCLRPTETPNEYVLRLYEPCGNEGTSELQFYRRLSSIELTDICEETIGSVSFEGNTAEIHVDPYTILTLRVEFA